jgi:hypothetical protein
MSPGRSVIAYAARHFDRAHDRLAVRVVDVMEASARRKYAREARQDR